MITCQYCGSENLASEMFCNECGKPLRKTKQMVCTSSSNAFQREGFFSNEQIPEYKENFGSVLLPVLQLYKGDIYELIYKDDNYISLEEFYHSHAQHTEDIIGIARRILEIIRDINNEGYVIGRCNLDDFIIMNNYDLMSIKLRISRKLLKNGELPDSFENTEFCAPEIRNCNCEQISSRTDVYLGAIIFNRFMMKNRYIRSDIDSQLKWAFYEGTENETKEFLFFHNWLGNSLNMFVQNRYPNLITSITEFDKCISISSKKDNNDIVFKSAKKTAVGSAKSKIMKELGKNKSEWNEDAISSYENANKRLYGYLLADGISNCEVGSGYEASNIIKAIFEKKLNELGNMNVINRYVIEEIIAQIIDQSNNEIREVANKYSQNPTNVMGSTVVIALIYDGILYYLSLGDSKLFLLRDNQIFLLCHPDNVEMEGLLNNIPINGIDNSEALTQYVGGIYAIKQESYTKHIESIPLAQDDYIVLASDGVLDYLGNNLHDSGWDREQILMRKIINHPENIEHCTELILRQCNVNGGGDNISVIVAKGERSDE